MPKERTGYISHNEKTDKYTARVTYTDEHGKQRSLKRICQTESQALKALKKLLNDIETRGVKSVRAERMTFAQLADYYEETYLVAAVYVEGRKVAGLRTYEDQKRRLKILKDYFTNRRLRDITYGSIEKFKRERLGQPTYRDRGRSLADVHRVLALLRCMLKAAEREGWLIQSPFTRGRPLITLADERKRERILSQEEEHRLLNACVGRRAHLKAVLICALDTGMRRGEIFSLKWCDVDFTTRTISIQAFNTKTMRSRSVPITERLVTALQQLYTANQEELVFGIRSHIWGALKAMCKEAEAEDFRLHDARHTCATRLVQGGLPLTEVARILGHTTLAMTYRYANSDNSTLTRAAAILDRLHARVEVVENSQPLIN